MEFVKAGYVGEHCPTIAGRLSRLREGDPVRLHHDGKVSELTVTRGFRRQDGFGSVDHAVVTVGYGLGRWNTEVSAARISAGFDVLEVPAGESQ